MHIHTGVDLDALIDAGNFICNALGRRWTQALCFSVAALCLLPAMLLPQQAWVGLVLLLLSKAAITTSFMVVYVQCAEIYPTTHRAAGTGLSSLVSSVFGTAAPYVAFLATTAHWLPYAVLLLVGVLGAVGAALLPETLGADLPQTLQEAEGFLVEDRFLSYKGRLRPDVCCRRGRVAPEETS